MALSAATPEAAAEAVVNEIAKRTDSLFIVGVAAHRWRSAAAPGHLAAAAAASYEAATAVAAGVRGSCSIGRGTVRGWTRPIREEGDRRRPVLGRRALGLRRRCPDLRRRTCIVGLLIIGAAESGRARSATGQPS